MDDEIINDTPDHIEKDVTDKDLLVLAERVLLGIGILFILGIFAELFEHDSNIFEACKTVLPSIATLIIGYYFAKSS